jgi:glycosyltransferase involved in cell wall biosynthesis
MSGLYLKRHCMVVFNQYPLGETRVQREAEALLHSGYEVDVICKRILNESVIDNYKGVRIFREKYHLTLPFVNPDGLLQRFFDYLLFFISAFIQLNRQHFHSPYASIQVHNLPDFLIFCAILQKIIGVPLILDLHDLMPEFFAGQFSKENSFTSRLIYWQEKISCSFSDHVITVSEHWRQALIQRGVPAEKCSVVMNVADNAVFHPVVKGHGQTSGRNGFRLIYHGTMVRRYGIDMLVQAVPRLRDQIPNLQLFLVGQGELLPELQGMIKQLNLEDSITIEPKQLAEQLPEIIQSCDLGIVPYMNDSFTDGLLPTKLMEYAALGMPAVASRTSAIQAYFTDSNVEFFEPGNIDDLVRCILFLYRCPKRLAELHEGCKKFNNSYNWTKISAEYVKLVQNLALRNKDPHTRGEQKSVEKNVNIPD